VDISLSPASVSALRLITDPERGVPVNSAEFLIGVLLLGGWEGIGVVGVVFGDEEDVEAEGIRVSGVGVALEVGVVELLLVKLVGIIVLVLEVGV
jgi:hypothetical protein